MRCSNTSIIFGATALISASWRSMLASTMLSQSSLSLMLRLNDDVMAAETDSATRGESWRRYCGLQRTKRRSNSSPWRMDWSHCHSTVSTSRNNNQAI